MIYTGNVCIQCIQERRYFYIEYNGYSCLMCLWIVVTHCGSPTSYRGTTCYSKSKTKPLCFLSENLENFLQNFFFFF